MKHRRYRGCGRCGRAIDTNNHNHEDHDQYKDDDIIDGCIISVKTATNRTIYNVICDDDAVEISRRCIIGILRRNILWCFLLMMIRRSASIPRGGANGIISGCKGGCG